jgi:hypothetical protein
VGDGVVAVRVLRGTRGVVGVGMGPGGCGDDAVEKMYEYACTTLHTRAFVTQQRRRACPLSTCQRVAKGR